MIAANDKTEDFYHANRSPSVEFFVNNWLRNQPSSKMAYLEGWQPNPRDVNYDVDRAHLFKNFPGQQGVQWDDQGPAGARWHGADRTPFGSYLKSPWSPERYGYYDEEAAKEDLVNSQILEALSKEKK